ncbi:MAG: SGNH/GDSL hydrolase family protein [Firmicutes bacterium]|nr:SGNH/GDSL hydrolase family protein [Bacillota bacterium]
MNEAVAKIFSKLVLPERTIRIKLLGDSITHGQGGTGFNPTGATIVPGYSRNEDGYCWAKLFKEDLESRFNCEVINNAITGINIGFIVNHFDQMVDETDDIIVCIIGTNNRTQAKDGQPKQTKRAYMELFYSELMNLQKLLAATGKDVIYVANIPASAENEKDGEDFWRLLHMNDVNDLYIKAAAECGFPLISLYSLFLDYCETKKIHMDSLLIDGLHPNDEGYAVIYQLMMKEIGLGKPVL